MGAGISPFAYAFIFTQDEHERLLIDTLCDIHVSVERQTELIQFEERGDRVVAKLRHPDERLEDCDAAFIIGCDDAHSRVREILSIGFPGGTYEHLFYVADLEAGGVVMNGGIHVLAPQPRGVLHDLPSVVAGASTLRSEGIAGRYDIVAGDFFDGVPEGADAYVLKGIIHDWPDESTQAKHRPEPTGATEQPRQP